MQFALSFTTCVVALCFAHMVASEEESVGVPRVHPVKNSAFCKWNFRLEDAEEDSYYCRNCEMGGIIQTPGGYTNLLKHCANQSCFGVKHRKQGHPEYASLMQPLWRAYWDAIKQGNAGIASHLKSKISPMAKKLHGWFELVVKCNLPLSVCENLTMRKHVKLSTISRRTLRKYLIKLADVVGLIIRSKIGPGNCVADGWSCAGVHCCAIIHRWPMLCKDNVIRIEKALLSCQPLINETSLDAESQADSIKATYDIYGSMEELIMCFTLDNTNTNPATARLCGRPMIGAHCHRLNLACRHWTRDAYGGGLMTSLNTMNAVMSLTTQPLLFLGE